MDLLLLEETSEAAACYFRVLGHIREIWKTFISDRQKRSKLAGRMGLIV
jgi:hypothetical protein